MTVTAPVAPDSHAPTPGFPIDPGYAELVRIPLTDLHESPLNRRSRYEPRALDDLKDSMLATGQLTPLIVRRREKGGGFEIAAGHRRLRAATLAVEQHRAGAMHRGLDRLWAIERVLDDRAFVEVLNVENLQRDDLHAMEEAEGFKDLMTECGYDVEKIAARIGKSDRYVYDSLTLLKLTPAAKQLFLDGVFERGHAIELARLTPEQQARALDLTTRKGGAELGDDSLLLEHDSAAEDEDELPLHDRVKPVSVREFKHAIQRNIRLTPEHVDPFLFPESARALEAAREEKLSVIHITREYLATDEVRQADQTTRVYGIDAWERADGKPDVDQFGDRTAKSKPCDWSRYGFVASGPGQGEVFKVCINKDKCATHWPEHVKRAEERKKRAKKQTKAREAGPDALAKEQAQEAAEDAKREREAKHEQRVAAVVNRLIQERASQWASHVLVIAKQIKLPGGVASWMAGLRTPLLDGVMDDLWYDVAHIEPVVRAMRTKLGGKWSEQGQPPRTAAAQPIAFALAFWLANELPRISDELEDEAEKPVKAEEAAEAAKAKAAKKPATKKAKKGSR